MFKMDIQTFDHDYRVIPLYIWYLSVSGIIMSCFKWIVLTCLNQRIKRAKNDFILNGVSGNEDYRVASLSK